jgi:hypothetical protein
MEIEFRIALVARDLHTGNFRKRQTLLDQMVCAIGEKVTNLGAGNNDTHASMNC